MITWEIFQDEMFYHMWAVRPLGDKNFQSPRLFHMATKEKAESLKELLEEAHMSVKVSNETP